MAELYQAYGLENDSYGGGGGGSTGNFFDEEPQQERHQKNGSRQRESSHQSAQYQQQQAPQPVIQAPMPLMPPKQQSVQEGFQNSPAYELKNYEKQDSMRRNTSYSFWDRMAMKRPEVIKLGVFALVIVLAIALERIGTHYLSKYLADNIFTDLQEFMLRLSYPILVFLMIWIIKSM